MKNKKDNLRDFLAIKNQTKTSVDFHFYGDIVSDSWGAWTEEDKYPDAVKTFLEDAKGKDLNIYINSGGGSVFAGMAIYNMLIRHQGYKTCYVDGLAGSISSVIALSCDRVIIPSNAYFMIHNAWTIAMGDSKELQKVADLLEVLNDGIANVYSSSANADFTKDKILKAMADETWMTGDTASKYFDKVETGKALEVVAYVGDYATKNCKNKPDFLNNSQNQHDKNNQKNNEIQKCKDNIRLLSLKGEF